MWLSATGAREVAPRLLNRYGVISLLQRWWFGDTDMLENYQLAATLYLDTFGERMPRCETPFEAAAQFVNRVNDEVFPVDIGAMDQWLFCIEDWDTALLQTPLLVETYGIAWEMADFVDFKDVAQLMIAICYEHLADGYVDEPWIKEWWRKYGYSTPPRFGWPDDRAWAIEHLRALKTPFNGLECVYRAVRKDNDNVFLDMCNDWRNEYERDMEAYWDSYYIEWLRVAYADVRGEIERGRRLERWCELDPGKRVPLCIDQCVRLEAAYGAEC